MGTPPHGRLDIPGRSGGGVCRSGHLGGGPNTVQGPPWRLHCTLVPVGRHEGQVSQEVPAVIVAGGGVGGVARPGPGVHSLL
jgi:hypothetical protein